MPKTLNDIVQEWKQRALEHPDGWLLKDFIRTAVKEAFEATFPIPVVGWLEPRTTAYILEQLKTAQDKFLGEEK